MNETQTPVAPTTQPEASAPTETVQPVVSPTPESKTQPKQEELASPRLAQMLKREQAIVKEREAIRAEREAFKAEQARIEEYKQLESKVKKIADLQKTNPIEAMKEAGFQDVDFINYLAEMEERANDTSTPAEIAAKAAKAELDKYKEEQKKLEDERLTKAQKEQQEQNDKLIIKYKDDILTHIKAKSDVFEFCNFYGPAAQELIFETVQANLIEYGEMLDMDEAAQMVEEYFEEQDLQMQSLKKRAKYQPKPEPKPTIVKAEDIQPEPTRNQSVSTTRVKSVEYVDNRTPVKTINNRMTASTPVETRELTPAENKQMIIEKYRQQYGSKR